jgi:hypothetical protein
MKNNKLYRFFTLGNDNTREKDLRHFHKMLIDDKFYFQSPDKFNDPFDCKPNLQIDLESPKSYESLYSGLRQQYPEFGYVGATRKIEEFIKNPQLVKKGRGLLNVDLEKNLSTCGILCFSAKITNMLLWAHYANGHKGYCIAFHKDKLLKFTDSIGILAGIKYQKTYPKINYFASYDSHKKISKIIFTKSKDWEYEEEWRLFIPTIEERLLSIPDTCIASVYLGLKMSPEDKDDILNTAQKRKLQLPLFQIYNSESKYALSVKKIN